MSMDASGLDCLRKRRKQETLALAGKLRERNPTAADRRGHRTSAAVAACESRDARPGLRGGRERESRVRKALGASRLRVRQLFTESLLRAALSGLAALLLNTSR
jgi:hypothetical protein